MATLGSNTATSSLGDTDKMSLETAGGVTKSITGADLKAAMGGGWAPGGTDIAVSDGGTGVSTLTGIVKGNGTSPFTAATEGTDYWKPGGTDVAVADGGTGASTLTGLVKGNGTSAFTAAVEGTDYWKPGGTDVAVADGGTGASTLTGLVKGNGTSAFTAAVEGTDYYKSGGTSIRVSDGGTGIASYTIGDIIYASGGTALSKLNAVATGNALISGGTSTAPSWGKIGLTTHVSGVLPTANGGMSRQVAILGASMTGTTTSTLADITGINAAVVSGSIYEIRAYIRYTSSDATNGLKLSATFPAATSITLEVSIPASTGEGLGSRYQSRLNTSGTAVVAASTPGTTGYMATISGIYQPSADGTFQLQYATEDNAATVVIVRNTTLIVDKIG